MPLQRTWRAAIGVVAMLCCAAMTAGCAGWRLPRIDPSGQQVLIWPDEPAAAIVGPPPGVPALPVAPVVGLPPGAPLVAAPAAVVGPPFGRVQAAPVYSDPPAVPLVPAPVPVAPFIPPPTVPVTTPVPAAAPVASVPQAALLPVTPMAAVGTPTVATALGGAVPAGVDHLRVAPAGVLAPVGSELVFKAAVVRGDGQPMLHQRVEWLLDRGGAGQFTDSAGREPPLGFAWWHVPRNVDPWHAVGSTTHVPARLTRGTPDPGDDIDILQGEAWATVTSASEGTSRVTAFAPGIGSFNRVITTIYWVDAQWIFPPSAVVEAGRPHVLTTTVMRRTDGAPLAGWLVRYDVAAGGTLGYEGGNVVEVPTDAGGRASVEVSPAAAGGGTTTVFATIIRPALAAPHDSPRFEIARGGATITWTTAAPAPITPAPVPGVAVTPPPPLEPAPRPALPPTPPAVEPYTPPADAPPPGQPQLELDLRRVGPEQVGVGEFVRFDVTVANRGTDAARGILVHARFDAGLRHPEVQPGEFAVEYPGIRDLAPGEAATVPLTYQVIDGGTQCHEVTITAEGAEPVSARGCVTGRQAALEVSVTGPRRGVVGESVEFSTVVRNVGDVPATNLELVLRTDAALDPTEAEPGHQRLPDGSIVLQVDRLDAGERRTFRMGAQCVRPADACTRAIVTADGGVTAAAEACLEILPPLGTVPDAAAAPELRLTVTATQNPARAGERQVVYVNVQNAGQQVARQVSVRVLLPPEMTPDAAQIKPQQGLNIVGQEVRVEAGELPPQGQFQLVIPVNHNRAGSVQIRAAAGAAGLATPITAESNVIEILPAAT